MSSRSNRICLPHPWIPPFLTPVEKGLSGSPMKKYTHSESASYLHHVLPPVEKGFSQSLNSAPKKVKQQKLIAARIKAKKWRDDEEAKKINTEGSDVNKVRTVRIVAITKNLYSSMAWVELKRLSKERNIRVGGVKKRRLLNFSICMTKNKMNNNFIKRFILSLITHNP